MLEEVWLSCWEKGREEGNVDVMGGIGVGRGAIEIGAITGAIGACEVAFAWARCVAAEGKAATNWEPEGA